MANQRILTTHTGSLPRPPELVDLILRRDAGDIGDPEHFYGEIARSTHQLVRQQVAIGIDIPSDGECGKPSYATYVKERLSGFGGPEWKLPAEYIDEFPDWERHDYPPIRFPTCIGKVSLVDPTAVRRDISAFKAALTDVQVADAFMSAASPGVIETFMPATDYYANDRAYLTDLAVAMRDEYQAIVEAGLVLQVDCPDLAMSRNLRFSTLTDTQFRAIAQMHVEVLNTALEGLPKNRTRLHLCWGNFEGPHNHDIPLSEILDIALGAHVGGLSFEAANPRHAHEWRVFEKKELPADLVLIPGVIDSCTNYVEHPELVAERLTRFAQIVGPERVIGGTDCGFGTAAGRLIVAPSIVWAKLRSLVDGARLASAEFG
jgi:5-methyltetrahydropteroyltriglutamate--homocysteine methyltransferase